MGLAVGAGVRSARSVDEVPEAFRWCRAAPGIVFPWSSPSGVMVEQYRPDVPPVDDDGRSRKYLFPTGAVPVLNVHPIMVDRLNGAGPVVVVEGTKQYLAAVTAARSTDHAVVGLAGCWGWSHDGAPIGDLAEVGRTAA